MRLLRGSLLAAVLVGTTALGGCGPDESARSGGTSTTTGSPGTVRPTSPATAPPTGATPRSPSPSGSPAVGPEIGPEKGLANALFGRSTTISNNWLPMRPGTQLTYEGHTIEDGERIAHRVVFTVTDLTKVIAGVRNVVVWDRDYTAGQLEETELAFFAQADDGTIWHFGQYPEVYEEGELVEAPAWIHGIQGAQAGITMKPNSQPGQPSYSQGWGPAVGWSDRARVYRTNQKTCVQAGCYSGVLVMDEFSADEPGARQLKYYAPGVGLVRVGWAGNDPTKETLELVKITRCTPAELVQLRKRVLQLERSAYKISKSVYGRTTAIEMAR
jgi:hypothetical protein